MKKVCMIPARLGSKRIFNKNLRLLDGKPLICYILETAIDSGEFDEIYINSSDEIFRKIADEYGVQFYKRPIYLSTDDMNNDDFLKDFIENNDCGDLLFQINTTSPFITVDSIKKIIAVMNEHGYKTMHTIKQEKIEGFVFNGSTDTKINFNSIEKMPRSQDLNPINLFCSSIMAWDVVSLKDHFSIYGVGTYGCNDKVGYVILEGDEALDIDEENDFRMAEFIIESRKFPKRFEPSYYNSDETDECYDEKVLIKDGVNPKAINFKEANELVTDIESMFERGLSSSWSKRIVDTENNSATLICQMPGEGNRFHYHRDWNEWWYIIEGTWKFYIDDNEIVVQKGDLVFIPKNHWHKIVNVGEIPAIRLAVNRRGTAHIYKKENSDEQISKTI